MRIQRFATAAECRLGTSETRACSATSRRSLPPRGQARARLRALHPVPSGAAPRPRSPVLPFPFITRSRGGGGGGDAKAVAGGSASGGGWNLPLLYDSRRRLGKRATAAVVLVEGAGAAGGLAGHSSRACTESRDRPALERKSGANDKGCARAKAPARTRLRRGSGRPAAPESAGRDRRKGGPQARRHARLLAQAAVSAGAGGRPARADMILPSPRRRRRSGRSRDATPREAHRRYRPRVTTGGRDGD